MKLTIKSPAGMKEVMDLNKDLLFNTSRGEQYIFSKGFTNYVLNFKDNQKSVELTFNIEGKSVKVELKNIVPFLQENIPNSENPTAIIINKNISDKDIDTLLDNEAFNGSEIIDRLEAIISKPVDLGNDVGNSGDLALISDFQSLIESLDAAAAGPGAGQGNATGNGSTFNSIFSSLDDSLNGIADTNIWENLSESISNIPVETGNTVAAAAVVVGTASITLDPNITADDIINAAESTQNIPVTGTVGGDVKVGDIVTLTVNGKEFTGPVVADSTGKLVFSIEVPGSDLVADTDKVIDAKVTATDASGNSVTATDTEGYTVDLVDSKDDTFTAKEEGSEWVNNVLVTNSPTEGYDATGNVFTNDNTVSSAVVTAIILAGVEYAIAQDGSNTVITTDKGTLSINNSGDFTYDVNEAYTESLNTGDNVTDTFTYIVNGDSTESAKLTINIEGTNDAPEINSATANEQVSKTSLFVEDFEGVLRGTDEIVGDGAWYVDNGTNQDGILVSNSGNSWYMNSAGVEMRESGGVEGLYAPNGSDTYIEMDAHTVGVNSSISTQVNLGTNNDTYDLSFDFKPRYSHEDSSDMIFSLDGKEVQINVDSEGNVTYVAPFGVDVTITKDETTGWFKVEATFTNISSDTATLTFVATGDADTFGGYIDNIQLVGNDYSAEKTVLTDIDLSDIDNDTLSSAKVEITNYKDGDVISEPTPNSYGITVAVTNGVVLLSGEATVEQYEEVLESLTFSSTSEDKTARTIEFTVNDGSKDSNIMTVSLDIGGYSSTSDNDAPVSTNDEISTIEDKSIVLSLSDFGTYSDVNGDSLSSIKITALPTNGTLTFNGVATAIGSVISASDINAGKLVFTPTVNTDDDSSFKFQVSDGKVWSSDYTTTVNVTAAADAPTASIEVEFVKEVSVSNVTTTSQELGNLIAYLNNAGNISADHVVALIKDQNGNPMQDQYNLQLTSFGQADLLLYDNVSNQNITRDINDINLTNSSALNDASSTIVTNTVNNTYNMTSKQVIFEGNIIQNGNVNGTNGNDVIIVKGEIQGGSNINAGSGNDLIAILGNIGANQPAIDGGNGIDVLYLNKPASHYYFSDIHFHDNLDGHIVDKDTGKTLTFNNIEGIAFGDGTGINSQITNYNEYKVDISAALADTDGSETLTVSITNVPTGATLSSDNGNYELVDNSDHTWSVTIPSGTTDISTSITMSVPSSNTGDINLGITAKATETNDNADGSNYETNNVHTLNFDGDDIDLTSILSTHAKVDVISLENSTNDKITVELNDLIADDDKQLIIRGDIGDVVQLDTPSDWSKAEQQEIDGIKYNVFTGTGTNSTIKLLIDDDIDVTPDI